MLAQAKLSRAPDAAMLVNVIEHGIRGTEMPGADSMSEREMKQTAAYVRSLGRAPQKPVPGNPARGAEIYRGKGNCATCHSIKGEGGISGPDLAGIGGRRSAGYFRESLVYPGAALPEGGLLGTGVTKDGPNVNRVRVTQDSSPPHIPYYATLSSSF